MNDRLQIAAMCLQGLLACGEAHDENTATFTAKASLKLADALLAECGEGEATQPRKVEPMEVDYNLTVDNFLAWQLPAEFSPDGGIRYQPTGQPAYGTNLFDFTQAVEMFRKCVVLKPRKVEVTEVESLLSNLIVAINDYNELERLYTLKDDHAFKDAERYINGGDA